jgi:hypothetical protein
VARPARSRLRHREHDRLTEVPRLLDIYVEAPDRLGEALQIRANLLASLARADLVVELDLRIERFVMIC